MNPGETKTICWQKIDCEIVFWNLVFAMPLVGFAYVLISGRFSHNSVGDILLLIGCGLFSALFLTLGQGLVPFRTVTYKIKREEITQSNTVAGVRIKTRHFASREISYLRITEVSRPFCHAYVLSLVLNDTRTYPLYASHESTKVSGMKSEIQAILNLPEK